MHRRFGVGLTRPVPPASRDGVLVPVELLKDELVGVARPFHERDVVVARVARHVHPRAFLHRRPDTTPTRQAALVSPTLGYLIGLMRG